MTSSFAELPHNEKILLLNPSIQREDYRVKHLMDQADCYWLAQLYGLYLVSVDFNQNPFTVLKFDRKGEGGIIKIEDGNGAVLAWQGLDYTDFPLVQYSLYACWNGEFWVCMLPSEY